MKVLQLCPKPPFPAVDGGCLAMHALTKGMIDSGIEVKILSIHTAKHPFRKSEAGKDYLQKTNIETVFVDTKVKALHALTALLSGKSYNIQRFFSKKFSQKLIHVLQSGKYDIVLLESIYMAPYLETIKQYSTAKVVLRSHNIEFRIWEQLAVEEANPLLQWYKRTLAKQLKQYELSLLNSCDGVASISTTDAEEYKKLGCCIPLITAPFGLDLSDYPHQAVSPDLTLFHIGAMDWRPNEEGIRWFLSEVWDKVVKEHPGLKLLLAGRNMPQWLRSYNSNNVIITGEVNDARTFMQENGIMLVPLHSGSGIRIKIVEAMAMGKPVITTALGAQGIPYENKKNLFIANTPNEFVDAIISLVSNPDRAWNIGNEARKLAERHYNNKDSVTSLISLFTKITANEAAGAALKSALPA